MELQADKDEMEREIHLLLQVDCEKSALLSSLETRASIAESNEQHLHEKIKLLSEGLLKLEDNLTAVKEKLSGRDVEIREL